MLGKLLATQKPLTFFNKVITWTWRQFGKQMLLLEGLSNKTCSSRRKWITIISTYLQKMVALGSLALKIATITSWSTKPTVFCPRLHLLFRRSQCIASLEQIMDIEGYFNSDTPTIKGHRDHKSFWSSISAILKACRLKVNIIDGFSFSDFDENYFEHLKSRRRYRRCILMVETNWKKKEDLHQLGQIRLISFPNQESSLSKQFHS